MKPFILRYFDRLGDQRGDDHYVVHAWSDNNGNLRVIKDNGEHLLVCKIRKILIKKNLWEQEELKVTENVIFNSILAKTQKFCFIFESGTTSYGLFSE